VIDDVLINFDRTEIKQLLRRREGKKSKFNANASSSSGKMTTDSGPETVPNVNQSYSNISMPMSNASSVLDDQQSGKTQKGKYMARNMLTLPKIPPRSSSSQQSRSISMDQPSPAAKSVTIDRDDHKDNQKDNQIQQNDPDMDIGVGSAVFEEGTLSVGLMRIADQVIRKVLPWQAQMCPRAVETLYDLRLGIVLQNHEKFMNSMKANLEVSNPSSPLI
jgi:hypothetical protein